MSGGVAMVEFEVASGCEVTLSLAVYPLPGGGFSFDAKQELLAARTDTFGPGRYFLPVTLPDGPTVLDPVASGKVSFGSSVALQGSTMVVAERGSGAYSGATYVFAETDDEWTRSQRLGPREGLFGSDVALDGNTLLVSDVSEDDERGHDVGAVHVFERESESGVWTRRHRIVPDESEEERFGSTVALDESTALVTGGTGRAYVYEADGNGWSRTATLVLGDSSGSESFSHLVGAISGDTVVLGSNDADAAYVFERSVGWNQTQQLRPEGLGSNHWFGYAVDVDVDRIVVADPLDDDEAESAGAIYVFEASDSGWEQTAKVTMDDADDSEYSTAGRALALRGDELLVGAAEDYVGGVRSGPRWGSAYLFENRGGTWTQQAQFIPSEGNRFGRSVALAEHRGAIGAAFSQPHGDVYVVEL